MGACCTGMSLLPYNIQHNVKLQTLETRFNTTPNNEFIETLNLYFAYVSFSGLVSRPKDQQIKHDMCKWRGGLRRASGSCPIFCCKSFACWSWQS